MLFQPRQVKMCLPAYVDNKGPDLTTESDQGLRCPPTELLDNVRNGSFCKADPAIAQADHGFRFHLQNQQILYIVYVVGEKLTRSDCTACMCRLIWTFAVRIRAFFPTLYNIGDCRIQNPTKLLKVNLNRRKQICSKTPFCLIRSLKTV